MKQFEPAIDQSVVWAAACMAYRINGGYIKVFESDKKDNKTLVREILESGMPIADEDLEHGQTVRDYISKVVTMASLKGTLDIWGQEMARASQLATIWNSYDLNVIASMPSTYARYLERERVHERLTGTSTDYQATIGDKIELDVEVLENKYSQKWATYYVTVVDTDNRAWYFAHRQSLKKGQQYTIRGTVKRLADRMVQLNRVKLLTKDETV
jgi:hypothetical protein